MALEGDELKIQPKESLLQSVQGRPREQVFNAVKKPDASWGQYSQDFYGKARHHGEGEEGANDSELLGGFLFPCSHSGTLQEEGFPYKNQPFPARRLSLIS